ncbi:MAG: 50S ribosome-binding GTPase [Planctomycetes bacterium]|nr:50S ribosome-binding GTPase [Planctomycetota bacterium]
MPANLTRPFLRARERFEAATDPHEQLDALQEMLREIPKHKGTEHLQADIKRRMKQVRESLQSDKHKSKSGVSFHVDKGRHPQVAVVGGPNTGKSAVVSALTGVDVGVAPYPYATREPHPAIMPFENARVQLVDLPPVATEHMGSWLPGIVRAADAALLVVDLTADDLLEATEAVLTRLAEQKVFLGAAPEERRQEVGIAEVRTLIVATHRDGAAAADAAEIFNELYGDRFALVGVDASRGDGVEDLRGAIWRLLDVIRAVPKPPGRPADDADPIVLRRGSTVLDMARVVHRELAERIEKARVWHSADHADGQWVGRDHVLADLEVVELGT